MMRMRPGGGFLIAAGAVFALYAANVTIGAATGAPFLTDVEETITLCVACLIFVVAVLIREAAERADKESRTGTMGG